MLNKVSRRPSDFLQPTRRVLVQQAPDQRLVRQAFGERPFLDRLQVLARQPDVQPPVLAKRGLCVTGVPGALAFATLGRLPFATLNRIEQLLLVGIKFHRRSPYRGTPWWLS